MKYNIYLVANGEYDKEIAVESEKMNAVMAELRATMDGAVQKRFLSELSREELKRVLEVNKKLVQDIDQFIMDDDMFAQEEEFNLLNIKDAVTVHDHYSSFFLRVNDPEKLIEKIDTAYLSPETEEQYKKTKAVYDELKSIEDENSEEYDKTYEKFEKECDLLADSLTAQLRQYEDHDLSEDNELEYLENYMNLDGLYILSDTYVVYEDITKSYN